MPSSSWDPAHSSGREAPAALNISVSSSKLDGLGMTSSAVRNHAILVRLAMDRYWPIADTALQSIAEPLAN
jgi:hypothetical protein